MTGWISALIVFGMAGLTLRAQRFSDFTTPQPVNPGDTLVVGFLGAFEKWNDPNRGVRKVALDLRAVSGVYTETIANWNRGLARDLIKRALDWNGNGVLDADERAGARIVLYGQSCGAEAAIDTARELNRWDVRVLLMIQIDSVGLHGGAIPPNVAAAANFFQHDLFTIWGRRKIYAVDPSRTSILGNFQFRYRHGDIGHSSASWVRRRLGGGHARMELDPAVWKTVEDLILNAVNRND